MPDMAIEFMDVIKAKSTYDVVYGEKYSQIEEQRTQIFETGQYDQTAKFRESLTSVKISKKEIVDTFAYNFNIDLKILEKSNLKNIFNIIKNDVIGHDEEIQTILKDIYIHFKTSNKPYSCFISGMPGIGKTLFFQVLSRYVANNNILKINCTDFSSSHSIDQLIGAPPGYIGFENGGSLTNFIQDNPNGVILFDEIEKANPLLYNYLLPLMDTGQITDRKGNVYNFKKGVIGFTSNVKSKSSISYTKIENLDISGHFKPEFIDRLTTIIAFKDLTEKAYELFYEKNKYDLKDKKSLINEAVKNNLSIRQFEKIINKKIHERYMGAF